MGRKKKIKSLKKLKVKKIKKGKEKLLVDQSAKQNAYKTKAFKANELKIKKIIKQPVEKKIYNVKDYVVYPKHGVGKIISVDKAKIGNIDITFYKVFIEKEKLTLIIVIIY